MKFNNVTSVVYQLPFGKGRKYGSNMNPLLDGVLGGWELNTINTAHTGTPLERLLHSLDGERGTADFRTTIAASRSCGPTSPAAPPARARRRC